MEEADREMLQVEAENRMRNLTWTVSGDYRQKVKPDTELYFRSRSRGLYQAACEGEFFRLYDQNELSLYILKKIFLGADSGELYLLVRMVMDAAAHRRLIQERPGAAGLRRHAASDFQEQEFERCAAYPLGRLELLWYGRAAGRDPLPNRQYRDSYEALLQLEQQGEHLPDTARHTSAMPVIETADQIYNRMVDPAFVKKHGGLEEVLAVSLEDLAAANMDWKEFLGEEDVTDLLPDPAAGDTAGGEGKKQDRDNQTIQVDERMRLKSYQYMELNYGRSYLKPLEQKRRNYTLCRGNHEGCRLYYTEGILRNCVRRNYQYEYVSQQRKNNLKQYRKYQPVVMRNISVLSGMLRQAMIRRNEREMVRSKSGRILPRELWRVGRSRDPRLFQKNVKKNHTEFVVDILIDASGSQRSRNSEVALQAYIISESLSLVNIPHQVQSFCTCWDFTILQRFRDYDDPREQNRRIFDYSTSANNRDGLAVRAATAALLRRPEENRILIILSDGRPNDRIVNHTQTRAPVEYVGHFAVCDTAEEIRKARHSGIAVLGVFAGMEQDLEAEKKIFGRDFAYIRNIQNFSPVVGRYLRSQLDHTG